MIVITLGFIFFFIFGYFRTQWQREHVLIYRTPLLRHMTPRDLLLLRSFTDDVKYVARKNSIRTVIFRVCQWSFTFEELVVNRLKYIGQVRLLDVKQDREKLLRNWGRRFIGEVRPARLRQLLVSASPAVWRSLQWPLISVLPAVWHKLPARGGVRYYIDAERGEEKWREEVEQAMSLARLIVVVLGTTPSLTWEMERVGQLRHAEKTLFVMPPLIRKKNIHARWQQFADLVCTTHGYDRRLLEKVDPKRVLAVVVRAGTLVMITGKGHSQTFYESALGVATIFAVTDPAQSGRLPPKYLD